MCGHGQSKVSATLGHGAPVRAGRLLSKASTLLQTELPDDSKLLPALQLCCQQLDKTLRWVLWWVLRSPAAASVLQPEPAQPLSQAAPGQSGSPAGFGRSKTVDRWPEHQDLGWVIVIQQVSTESWLLIALSEAWWCIEQHTGSYCNI